MVLKIAVKWNILRNGLTAWLTRHWLAGHTGWQDTRVGRTHVTFCGGGGVRYDGTYANLNGGFTDAS